MPLKSTDWVVTIDSTTRELTPTAKVTSTNMVDVIASNAETITGTLTTKAVTPAALKAGLPYVSLKQFGAVGDGVTNDTVAVQAFVDYITTNHRTGWMPKGIYLINGAINFPSTYGWAIIGDTPVSGDGTVIKQNTNNVPIFNLGSVSGSQICHSVAIRNLHFTYTNVQAAANTLANPIWFASMYYFSTFENLQFQRGFYAMKAAAGIEHPWGNTYDKLIFGSELTGGAYNTSGCVGSGVRNHWGSATFNCNTMVGPVFYAHLADSRIDAFEFLTASLGPTLLQCQAGSVVSVGSIRIENATYTAGKRIIYIEQSSDFMCDSLLIGGDTLHLNPTPGGALLALVEHAGTVGSVQFGAVIANVPTTVSGGPGPFLFGTGGAQITVNSLTMGAGWTLHPVSWAEYAKYITVTAWLNQRLSDDKGNADYTVVSGDPTRVHFNTAFTLSRTITLPAKVNDNLCAGQYYEFIFYGAINGANTAVIKEGANTLRTQTTDKVVIGYTWRRAIWVMTKYETLP